MILSLQVERKTDLPWRERQGIIPPGDQSPIQAISAQKPSLPQDSRILEQHPVFRSPLASAASGEEKPQVGNAGEDLGPQLANGEADGSGAQRASSGGRSGQKSQAQVAEAVRFGAIRQALTLLTADSQAFRRSEALKASTASSPGSPQVCFHPPYAAYFFVFRIEKLRRD